VIDEWNARRAQVAAWYDEHLPREVLRPCVPDGLTHVYHLYVLRHPERDAIAAACKERKVDCAAYYTRPLQLQPAFAEFGHQLGDFPVTDAAAAQNLAIPMHPNLTEAQVREVAAAVAAGLA
jgi:dTDP-4-amino-4,6-dideoxygalactose transaminase